MFIKYSLPFFCFVFLECFVSIQFIKASWIDPDTPLRSRTTESHFRDDSRRFDLVFSDEFEQEGRDFSDGSDPRWTALHKNDCELM